MNRRIYPLLIFLVFTLLYGCAANPVTGKKELYFISESAEVRIGNKNYLFTQQAQGGEYVIDPELSAYVNSVGQRIARVSNRPNLPYEFVVLNNSVPNAWALPGGKIAVYRGLLLELNNEAELAAVLSHEIVHVAARHSAKSVERGVLLQAGMIGIGLAVSKSKYADILVGATSVGVGLISRKYSRSAELEADQYGIKYMALAGYDSKAAISLQETFVRLSKDKKSNWLLGLFSTHPPSQERVNANIVTAANLSTGGQIGLKEYQSKIAGIKKTKMAYVAHDDGRKALAKGDSAQALSLADKTIRIEPREAIFYGLMGDAKVQQKRYREALTDYDKAIKRNNRFFQFFLQRGLVREKLGDLGGARSDLQKSVSLLPTAHAHYSLGNIALTRHQRNEAIEHFRVVSSMRSEVGRKAWNTLARLELPQRSERYIAVKKSRDRNGYVIVTINNKSPVSVKNVAVSVTLRNKGKILGKDIAYFQNTIGPSRQSSIATRIGPLQENKHLRQVRVKVIGAIIAK